MAVRFLIQMGTELMMKKIPAKRFQALRNIMAARFRDSDQDGVNDEKDQCPDEPGSQEIPWMSGD